MIAHCAVTSSVNPVAEVTSGRVAGGCRRPHRLNATGQSRLHVASRLNKVSDVVTLIVEGADINAKDYAGLPLSFFTTSGQNVRCIDCRWRRGVVVASLI